MPSLYPSQSSIKDAFSPQNPELTTTTRPSKPRFAAWSASEKAAALSAEAQAEIKKASAAAQAKTGQIELYSAKYYAACTLGGLLACVGIPRIVEEREGAN